MGTDNSLMPTILTILIQINQTGYTTTYARVYEKGGYAPTVIGGYSMEANAPNIRVFNAWNGGPGCTATTLPRNTWAQSGMVFYGNGTNVTVYRDGAINCNSAAAATMLHTTDKLTLGADKAGTGNFFNGSLDEFFIYNRSLSTAEIVAVNNGQVRFQDGNDTSLSLDAGSGNDWKNVSVTFTNGGANTSIDLYVAVNNDNSTWSFSLVQADIANGTTYTVPTSGRYMQIRRNLKTNNGAYTDSLLTTTANAGTVAGGDTTKPLVQIQQPTNIWYSTNPPLNFTATDETAISACWYSLNNWATNTTIASCANLSSFAGSSQGSNTVKLGVNDTSNNINNTASATYSFDTLNPSVTINTPTNTTYQQDWVILNTTITDTNLNNTECYYTLNNGVSNQSYNCINITIGNFADGGHTLRVIAKDLAGNFNTTSQISFTTDTKPPSVIITNPANSTYTTGDLTLETTISDLISGVNTSTCRYSLDSWASNTSFNCISSPLSLPNGAYHLQVAAADNQANWNTTSQISFTVAIPPAAPAPSLINQSCIPGTFSLTITAEYNASAFNASLNYGNTTALGTLLWNTTTGTIFIFRPSSLQDNTSYSYNFTRYNSTGGFLENGSFACSTELYVPPPPSTFAADNAPPYYLLLLFLTLGMIIYPIGKEKEDNTIIFTAATIFLISGVMIATAGIHIDAGKIAVITGNTTAETTTYQLVSDGYTRGLGLIFILFSLNASLFSYLNKEEEKEDESD